MTLDLPTLRLLAWQGPFPPCETCEKTQNHRCTTSSDNLTIPHASRMKWAAGYDARQPEVDDLQRALDLANATVTDLSDGLRTITTNAAELTEQLKTARIGAALVPGLQQRVAELMARVAELEKPPVEPESEPATSTTRFGACPPKPGGTNLAAQAKVITKWGKGASVRVFCAGLGSAVDRHPDASIIHYSFKEFDKADVTDKAKVKATLVNVRAGDVVEIIHESDNDGLDAAGVATRIELKNLFFATVKAVRPDVLVAHTMTGWIYEPKSKLNPFVWAGKVKADVLGIDCDGIRPTALPYTDYVSETARILAIVNDPANGYRYFSVPEFGCPRIPSADPDGSIRAAWHEKYATLWAESGKCLSVELYEFDSSPNYSLTTAAEVSGWKRRVG